MAKHGGVGTLTGAQVPVQAVDQPTGHAPKHAAGRPRVSQARRVAASVVLAVVIAAAFVVIGGVNSTPERAAAQAPSPEIGSVDPPAQRGPGGNSSTGTDLSASSAADTLSSSPAVSLSPTSANLLAAALPLALPETGPGVTQPGILLFATPTSDGSFDVVERVRLASPVSELTLRPPPVAGAGRQFAAASAVATQVQVTAGDQPVVVPGARVDGTVLLAVPQLDRFDMRYLLTDVTIRSTPSTAGRALAAIGPLTDGGSGELPVSFIVSGGTILGLNCPLLPLSQQSCGSRSHTGPGVTGQLPWQLALISVQFNLPPA